MTEPIICPLCGNELKVDKIGAIIKIWCPKCVYCWDVEDDI